MSIAGLLLDQKMVLNNSNNPCSLDCANRGLLQFIQEKELPHYLVRLVDKNLVLEIERGLD